MSLNQDNSTRNKILSAGIKVFAEKGYKDATVREICKEAGTANINSINYYFRSKERLYREILEIIFSEYDKFDLQDWEQKSPQEQFKEMILNFCRVLYKNNTFSSDITAIFVNEMTRPTPFLVDFVDQYNRPRVKQHLKMFKGLLGEDASEDMARDCLVSVSGQLLYYSFAWPVFSRLFPDYSANKSYEMWAEHVFEFSMGGIASLKEQLKKRKEGSHGN